MDARDSTDRTDLNMVHASPISVPLLRGLVLAGGEGRRMGGRDKGRIRFGAEPQARAAWRLLAGLCAEAFVAARAEQAAAAPYADLPLLVDDPDGPRGPAAGLLSAWQHEPGSAWLVLATDLPRVDEALLAELIRRRDPTRLATVFRHADGALEPLCAIWEPTAREPLLSRIARGDSSLRRLLECSPVRTLEPPAGDRLINVNSPEDLAALRAR